MARTFAIIGTQAEVDEHRAHYMAWLKQINESPCNILVPHHPSLKPAKKKNGHTTRSALHLLHGMAGIDIILSQ